MHDAFFFLWIAYKLAVIAAVVHVLMDRRQPVKTMAWAMVIYFVPVIGIVLYLFFGVNTRRERLISKRSMDEITRRSMLSFIGKHSDETDTMTLGDIPEQHRQTVDFFINRGLALPFEENDVDIYTGGEAAFGAVLNAIRNATEHIHVDMYIFADDSLGQTVADALCERARHGVEVRVIYDDVGCWRVKSAFFERMRECGVEVCPFLPVRFPSFTSKVNYRNHRKIIVVDGNVGFIGGMNIARRYVRGARGVPWRDTMVRITGDAVYSLQRAFLIDWYFVDRTQISARKYYPPVRRTAGTKCMIQIVTSDALTPYSEIMQGYMRVILNARRYVYIQTPYFLPTEPVACALKTAALSGVDVCVMVPERSDTPFISSASMPFLREMAAAGVNVALYTAGFLHSKILVADDNVASCGSTNIDARSFDNNFESNAFFFDTHVAVQFRDIFLDDMTRCRRLADDNSLLNPPLPRRLAESVTRLLAPLL